MSKGEIKVLNTKRPVNEDLLKSVENLLEFVKTGQVTSAVFAYPFKQERGVTTVFWCDENQFELIGALSLLGDQIKYSMSYSDEPEVEE